MSAVRSQNERVELAMQILECRRKLRQTRDDAVKTRAEMESLEQKLREIDE